jgi:hypothetical protein
MSISFRSTSSHVQAFIGFGVSLPLTLKAISALRHHPCPGAPALETKPRACLKTNKPVRGQHSSEKTFCLKKDPEI